MQKANVVRLNADGSIDLTFNLSQIVTDWYRVNGFGTIQLAASTDGKIIIGASRTSSSNTVSIPLVLDPDGAKSSSFNPTIFNTRNGVWILDIAQQSDGKILIAGRTVVDDISSSVQKGFIARLNANGTVDSSFQISEPLNNDIVAFSVLQNGQILIVTRTTNQGSVLRLNPDGSPDSSFNSGSFTGRINAISVLSSGKILVGGLFAAYSGQSRRNLALLNADGTFSDGMGDINDEVLSVKIDNNGRILIGGSFTSISTGGHQVITPYVARLIRPTVTVSVRILTPEGAGLRNAAVTISDEAGVSRSTSTSSLAFTALSISHRAEHMLLGFRCDGIVSLPEHCRSTMTWRMLI